MPSETVEDYLKAIHAAEASLGDADALVPMGQVASALGVVPGTATTMVKALARSGLVRYEPYSGVRLTPAGTRLASLVVRRHRLVEQFLVQMMGMSWADVHAEAERLEHAVSDRLIARIDEMLGHPSVDPHGDPIPDAAGSLAARAGRTLLSCPTGSRVRVLRVLDQDAAFLRFVEQHGLTPGEVVSIEARDPAADRLRVRRADGSMFTLGAGAASKLVVGPA